MTQPVKLKVMEITYDPKQGGYLMKLGRPEISRIAYNTIRNFNDDYHSATWDEADQNVREEVDRKVYRVITGEPMYDDDGAGVEGEASETHAAETQDDRLLRAVVEAMR